MIASNPVSARQASSGDIASLNGVRALAVALVFFSHGGMDSIVPGGLGVTVFFVLSGYLITTLLRREFASSGAIRLPAFYLRRVLRLIPPLVVVVALAAMLAAAGAVDGQFTWRGLLSVLFYFGNYHVIAQDFGGIPAGMGVIWSLAVEEHYYLLYPPLALLLMRSRRPSTAILVLSALCAAILAWRFTLALNGASDAYIGMASDTRADAILIGCVMAFACNPATGAVLPARAWRDGAIVAVCLLVLIATLVYRDEFFRLSARYTLQSLAIAPLLYLAVARAEQWPFSWLNTRAMQYLGTVSYTVYLSHQLIYNAVAGAGAELNGAIKLALTVLLTLILAEAMRRWIEQPFARLRRQLHARPSRSTTTPHGSTQAVTP